MKLFIAFVSLAFVVLSCVNHKRKQEPQGPVTYNSTFVIFQSSKNDIHLSGTLTTPEDDSLKTAVVLVSGSGPDDRDYTNQFGHKPFLVLAHYLTLHGITVLRYDERGVGESEGNFREATYEDLIKDVEGAVRYLRSNNFARVGIIGHSEGGGIAPAVSLQTQTDFLVLMAPDNSTADKSLIAQTDQRLKHLAIDRETSQDILETLAATLAILKSEDNPAIAEAKMKRLVSDKTINATDKYKEAVQKLGDPHRLIDGFLDPKFIYRLRHDPKDVFRKVDIPVFVLVGQEEGPDYINTNVPAIEAAFRSTPHDVRIFPGIGHLFMNSSGVPVERLHELEETIAPEVLDAINVWIKKPLLNESHQDN